jgi:hypothetical protein
LYYLPIPTLCHEVGISKEGASKALRSLAEFDYAHYDDENEIVWVPGAAKYQVGESLKPGDKKIIGIVKDLQKYAKSVFCRDFYRRYAGLYHLPMIEMPAPSDGKTPRTFEAPSEGHPFGVGVGDIIGDRVGVGNLAGSDKKQSLPAVTASSVFLKIPLIDKTEFELLQGQVDEWKGLYLAVDVEQECRNYLGWTKTHPKQRKTRDGILRSMDYWLRDKQNKGGGANGSGKPSVGSGVKGDLLGSPKFDQEDLPEWAKPEWDRKK